MDLLISSIFNNNDNNNHNNNNNNNNNNKITHSKKIIALDQDSKREIPAF